MTHSLLLLNLLSIHIFFATSLTLNSTKKIQNASHQIYSFTNPTELDSLNIINCNTPNCIIQCMVQNACNDLTITASNTHNLDILCDAYESCIHMKLTANNHTKVNIKCLHSHSCTQSIISTSNSYITLQCNGDSCTNTTISIDTPLPNAITLSCATEDSCKNLEILTRNTISFAWSDIHWLNISKYTKTTNILLLCDADGLYNVTLLYSHQTHEIQCDHDEICCPSNYIPFEIDPTAFYSTTQQNTNSTYYELSDLFLFEYFDGYTAPLLCISLLYTICVFCWAMIYFCCNTLSIYNKYKSNPNGNDDEAMTNVCETSCCWNKCGYFVDGLSVISDFAILTSIFLYSILLATDNKRLWFFAFYLSVAATGFGVIFYIYKLRILTVFYPYIMLWRTQIDTESAHLSDHDLTETQKAMKWNEIQSKMNKISQFLKYLVMYDLLSASLQDSLQSVVILCVLRNYNEYSDVLLDVDAHWSEWSIFEWILRIKLIFCFMLMIYKLLNGMSVECKCYLQRMDNKVMALKPHNIVYIGSDDDRMDMNDYQQYHSIIECDHDRESPSEVQIKYEYRQDEEELKQLELNDKWSMNSTGAITMNVWDDVNRIENFQIQTESQKMIQSIEMGISTMDKTGENGLAIDVDDEKIELLSHHDRSDEEEQQMNMIISPNQRSRKGPLSISRTKSQQMQKHHVMSNNNNNNNNDDEDTHESNYDTDPLSLDTEVIYD